jgi:DNA-directed RNA polymerase specialized sigma24 family protein
VNFRQALGQETGQRSFVAGVAAQYGQRLRRFLASRLRDPRDASDIAQEVYLRLLRVERHELIRNPEAYLLTIASHLLHEQALRRAAAPSVVDIESVAPELRSLSDEWPGKQRDSRCHHRRELVRLTGALHRRLARSQVRRAKNLAIPSLMRESARRNLEWFERWLLEP